MRTQTLILFLLLAGCLGAGSRAPAGEPAAALPAAPQASPGLAPPSEASPPAPSDTLSAALRARCDTLLPTAPDRPLAVVGRVQVSGGELLRVAWAEPSGRLGPTVPETELLYVRADACVDPYRTSESAPWAALRALHASPTVNDRIVAVEVEAEGGVEAVQREIDASREASFAIRECWPGEPFAEAACTRPELAAAYRRAGLQIEGPRGEAISSRANLSAVPDSLRGCLPRWVRQLEGDVVYVGPHVDGARRQLLFAAFGPNPIAASIDDRPLYAAVQEADGSCQGALNASSEDGARLLWEVDELELRLAQLVVRRAGGADEYVRLYRAQVESEGPYACSPAAAGSDTECMSGPTLQALWDSGVPVRPWPY